MKYRVKECWYTYSDYGELKTMHYYRPQYKKFLFWHNFTEGWGDNNVDFKEYEEAVKYIKIMAITKPKKIIFHEVNV